MISYAYGNRFLKWSTAAILYGLCFFIRISPNTLQPHLQADLHLSYADVGLLSASFYYSYGFFQVAGAMLSRKIGLHRCFISYLCLLIIGVIGFASSQNFATAVYSRIFMGIGASLCFFYSISLARVSFPRKDFPIFVGLTNFAGMLGALFAQTPLELLLQHYKWPHIFLGTLLVIGALLPSLVWPHPDLAKRGTFGMLWSDFHSLRSSCKSYLGSVGIALVMITPLLVIPEMWGDLFLETIYSYDSLRSSFVLSVFFIGVASGSLLQGWMAKKLPLNKLIPFLLGLESIALMGFLFPFHPSFLIPCFFAWMIGYCASGMLLFFSLLDKTYDHNVLAIPLFNMMIMIGSSAFQPLIGFLLDSLTPMWGLLYALWISLSILPIMILLSLVFLLIYPL